MDSGLEKYDIYEPIGIDSVSNYFIGRLNAVDRLRIERVSSAHYAIYTAELAEEEASFIMLSIPDIIIKKCSAKVNT